MLHYILKITFSFPIFSIDIKNNIHTIAALINVVAILYFILLYLYITRIEFDILAVE